jgi:hypothetical protein
MIKTIKFLELALAAVLGFIFIVKREWTGNWFFAGGVMLAAAVLLYFDFRYSRKKA